MNATFRYSIVFSTLILALASAFGKPAATAASDAPVFGPFHATASGAGPGHVGWFDGTPPTEAQAAWTVAAWVKPAAAVAAPTLVAGFGDGTDYFGAQRYIGADANGWFFWYGGFRSVKNPKTKKAGAFHRHRPPHLPGYPQTGRLAAPGRNL